MFLPDQLRECLRSVEVFFHMKRKYWTNYGKAISTSSLHSSIPENTQQIQMEFTTWHFRRRNFFTIDRMSGVPQSFLAAQLSRLARTRAHTHTHTHASVGKFGTCLYISCCVSKGMWISEVLSSRLGVQACAAWIFKLQNWFKHGSVVLQASTVPSAAILCTVSVFSMLSVKWLMPSRERDDVTTC